MQKSKIKKTNFKYSQTFSLFEILIYLIILSILSLSIIKPQLNEIIGIRAATSHIQKLQKDINENVYFAFLQKKNVDKNMLLKLLNNGQTNNHFFILELRNNTFILTINNKKLRMPIKENINGTISITCNPNQELCRKLYHRKQSK